MRYLTYRENGQEKLGVLSADYVTVYDLASLGCSYSDMNELIESMTKQEQDTLEKKMQQSKGIPYDAIEKCAPIPVPKQDIICLGINYMAHAEESARYKKEAFGGERPYPVYFSKRVDRAVPDGGMIQSHSDIVERLDYEVELAVIIGKEANHVSREDAYDYVFGYTVMNDVSAREVQIRHKQWYFGKGLDGFTPMGPCIVTADEIPGKPDLSIRSTVNGELRQDSTTDLLIFDVAYVISELSQGMTLQPGTIIAMGTPAGVGMGFEPPRFLKSGDVVTCEIHKIGRITNIVC
ncbi:MAG: fumarylacetoacetate hydrolase family protein [Lachnospiraceae bacterium]|nr:fumarylacetoacetate hydrolase family protein [Lachnospiraceae bacterium]